MTKVHRSTVKRGLKLLEDCGYIRRRPKDERRRTAEGDDDINDFALPALVDAWLKLTPGVGADNSGGWAHENPEPDGGWARECAQGGRVDAPHPSEDSSESGCCGSAHARASTEDQVVQSFLNGDDLAKPDGLTEQHLEQWRELADRFGRRPGAMVVRPTERIESDPILIRLVQSELAEFPAAIVGRAVTAALLQAETSQISAQQDGSAGRGRGGLISLQRYVLKMLRSTANDMVREAHASEAKNRAEKVTQETRLAVRVSAAQAGGRRSAARSGLNDLAADMWGTADGDRR